MYQPLDGPSLQTTLSSVGTVTVVEAKVGATALAERKVVTLQGDGKFLVYFGDDSGAPSAATVTSDGITVFKDQVSSFEATGKQPLYVLAVSGTVNIKIVERA
jgi:hypothetical protein